MERPSALEETLSALVEQRCKRFDVEKPLASRRSARVERLSALEETLSALVEQRCKRFDVVKPLASRRSAFVERLSALEETLSALVEQRCKRFDVVKPLASRRAARVERPKELEETPSACEEQRCKRFDDVKPLASRRSARAERPSVLEETLSAFVERLSALEETLSPFAEHRCKRFDDVKPLASPPSIHRPARFAQKLAKVRRLGYPGTSMNIRRRGDTSKRSCGHDPRMGAALVLASSLLAAACVHAKGESQLVWLQSGLESEFPDHGAGPVDLSGTAQPVSSHPSPPLVASRVEPAFIAPPPVEPSAALVDESTAARPVIRVTGTGKPHRAGDDRIELTVPDEHATATAALVAPAAAKTPAEATAKQEYDHALSLLNAHDYDRAKEAFLAFLIRWPDDANAEAALYWSGECYLAKGEVVEASEQFETALTRFPQGTKVPDDLLKLGIAAQRLGNKESAKTYFDRLTHDFPRSDAARRIPHDRASGAL